MKFNFNVMIGIFGVVICLSFGQPVGSDKNELAALKAANYLLSQADDFSWGGFTPRVLTSLTFLERLKIPESNIVQALNKELQGKEGKTMPPIQLAQYINGLYSTCQDPRDFEGKDLIELLRQKYEKMDKTKFKLPLIVLSLCIAREATLEDSEILTNTYDIRNENIALKALTIIAMAACKDLTTIPYLNEMKSRLYDFLWLSEKEFSTSGINTKALIIQAYNAWDFDSTTLKEQLLSFQQEDGSFGNFQATYNAIPSLMNKSLAVLKCKRTYKGKEKISPGLQGLKGDNYVDWTIIVQMGENIGRHTIRLFFAGKMSLYQLMTNAAKQSTLFRFQTEEIEGVGKRVIGIAGISDDPESGMKWVLYKRPHNGVMDESTEKMVRETNDIVDFIFPQDGDHYLLQLEMD